MSAEAQKKLFDLAKQRWEKAEKQSVGSMDRDACQGSKIRVAKGVRPYDLQPTIQPTKSDVMYDFRVLRQPPRSCKSLKNLPCSDSHGGSHGFESCSAHHPNQSVTEHLAVLAPDCSAMCLKSWCDGGSPSTQIGPWTVVITRLRHQNCPRSRAPMGRVLRRELSARIAVAPAASLDLRLRIDLNCKAGAGMAHEFGHNRYVLSIPDQ